jgi:hypothetical protein
METHLPSHCLAMSASLFCHSADSTQYNTCGISNVYSHLRSVCAFIGPQIFSYYCLHCYRSHFTNSCVCHVVTNCRKLKSIHFGWPQMTVEIPSTYIKPSHPTSNMCTNRNDDSYMHYFYVQYANNARQGIYVKALCHEGVCGEWRQSYTLNRGLVSFMLRPLLAPGKRPQNLNG